MTSAFSQSEYELAYPPGIEHHFWTRTRVLIISTLLKKFKLEGKRILEIGCGKGIVVNELRKRNFDCYGVELAEVEQLAVVRDFVYVNQDAFAMRMDFRNSIDVILLLDVIEHIEDAVGFMQNIKASYPNASALLITVPARKAFWSNYDEFYGHFRRYDLSMTRELGVVLNLQPKVNSYFFHALYYVAFLIFKLKGKREIKSIAPRGWRIGIHRLLAGCMKIEYHLLPSFVPGSSIITLFKRS